MMTFDHIHISADWHGEVLRIRNYCKDHQLTEKDLVIVTGDAGLNFHGYSYDKHAKEIVNSLGPTFLFVHGNHEMKPSTLLYYEEISWAEGRSFCEEAFPNLIFAKDGEIYRINDKNIICIGGAYSVDKSYRLWHEAVTGKTCWWKEEQLNEDEKHFIEQRLHDTEWKVDYVFSHTVPYKYLPIEAFLKGIDQSTVDHSMERWLDRIEEKLRYEKWYAGHFHCSKQIDKLEIVYENYHEITFTDV